MLRKVSACALGAHAEKGQREVEDGRFTREDQTFEAPQFIGLQILQLELLLRCER